MLSLAHSKFNKWKADLLHAIYPNLCIVCETETPHIRSTICPVCESELHYSFYENYTEPTPLDELFWGRTFLHSTYALLLFNEGNSTQHILHTLKYKNRSDLAVYMGSEIGKRIHKHHRHATVEALIPVPLHPKKEFIRGYNQAEEIAKGIAEITGIPVRTDVLERTVFTESQTKKGKLSRWDNMQNRFATRGQTSQTFRHIALVDDVVTTGSTLETCIGILKNRYPDLHISVITLAMAQ